MTASKRGSIRDTLELIGMGAVVASLLLVAYEVRQSNRIAQATTTYEIGRDVNEFNTLGYSDPEFTKLLLKLRDKDYQPDDIEALQIQLLANRFVNLWTIQEKAYRNGLLSAAQFDHTRKDVITVMTVFPALVQPLRGVFEYQPGLRDSEVLEPLLANSPSPDH